MVTKFDALKLNWIIDIVSYIPENHNLGHLGADLSILKCKKRFRGDIYP
jgi:hypothetical protein